MTSIITRLHHITGYGTAARVPDSAVCHIMAKEINETAKVIKDLLFALHDARDKLKIVTGGAREYQGGMPIQFYSRRSIPRLLKRKGIEHERNSIRTLSDLRRDVDDCSVFGCLYRSGFGFCRGVFNRHESLFEAD